MSRLDWKVAAKYISDNYSDEEKKVVEEWVLEKKENEKGLEELKKIWDTIELEQDDKSDPEEIWKKMQQELSSNLNPPVKIKKQIKTLSWRMAGRVIVSVVLMLAITYLVSHFPISSELQGETESAFEVVNVESGKRKINLPDGSVMWLNSGAWVKYPKDFTQKRAVVLSGEAYFDVVRDERKPFVIQAGPAIVQVLGTSFNVNAKGGEEVTVGVTSGSVAVRSLKRNAEVITLKQNEQVRYSIINNGFDKKVLKTNLLSWHTGKFEFMDVTLTELTSHLSSYYQKRFVLDIDKDPQITVNFDNASLDEVLDIVSAKADVKYDIGSTEVSIYQ